MRIRRSYEATVTELVDDLAGRLALMWETMTPEQFTRAAGDLLEVYGQRARLDAWRWFVRTTLAQTGVLVTDAPPALAGVEGVNRDRAARAVQTITGGLAADDELRAEVVMRLNRLVDGALSQAAADEIGYQIRHTGIVDGWARGVESGACELCRWWAREGRTWPADHPMPRHKGCKCSQSPVFDKTGSIHHTGYTRGEREAVNKVAERLRREEERANQ